MRKHFTYWGKKTVSENSVQLDLKVYGNPVTADSAEVKLVKPLVNIQGLVWFLFINFTDLSVFYHFTKRKQTLSCSPWIRQMLFITEGHAVAEREPV